MKRTAVIILAACTLSFNACAQWYLFPGQKKQGEDNSTTVKEEKPTAQPENPTEVLFADQQEKQLPAVEEYAYEELSTVNAALILPLQSASSPSANFFEMYNGALLAARQAGEFGTGVNLNVFDSTDGSSWMDFDTINSNNLIIGPVSTDELEKLSALCSDKQYIVSPLEPKAAALADSLNIFHAPTPWTCQLDELVNWIGRGVKFNERIVVIKDPKELGEQSTYLLEKLNEKGLVFITAEAATAETIPTGIEARCLIVSDRDDFISSVIRSLNTLVTNDKKEVTLYGNSKTRTAASDVRLLHNLNAHITAAFYIDYDSPKVKDFVLAYRALFKNEPGSFAFQGYDTMHYFLNLCRIYGVQWYKKLSDFSESGLQADFNFPETETKGCVNTAIRRIVFNSDLSSSLQ